MELFSLSVNIGIALIMFIVAMVFIILYLLEHRKRKQYKIKYETLDREYIEVIGKSMQYQLEYQLLNEDYKREKDQSEEIQKLNEKTRRLKHDMKNHILVITSFLNGNKYDEAKEYLSLILDKLNQIYTYIETGNSILNYIINTKLEYAKQNGIDVKAEIENIPFEIMGSVDFSSLLSNLFDNAIEASIITSNREIHVNILRKRAYDTILIKNRVNESVLERNPKFISSKTSNGKHGYGIKQIKSIVEKYDGMIDFYEEDGMFCVYVMVLSERLEQT
ncbi:MAG: sensor histidine kinase [Clostridium sp.]|uniref:sensor histidine kinase n=1 Tax=Clostridium sp. TaxID=1506 RepID=UPI003D6D74D5